MLIQQLAFDVRDNMHNVAIAFDCEAFCHRNRAGLGHAANIISAKVKQHKMLGAFLGIGEKVFFMGDVFGLCLSARTCARNRADRYNAVA